MNEKKLDAILCSHFGYTKGPFATMREVYIFNTCTCLGEITFDPFLSPLSFLGEHAS